MRSAVLVVEKDGQRWSPNLSEFQLLAIVITTAVSCLKI